MSPTALRNDQYSLRFAWLALGAILFGCQSDQRDLTALVAGVSGTSAVAIEPSVALATVPAFVYSASHLRSPFLPATNPIKPPIAAFQSQCQRPNPTRNKHPLEHFGIDSLTLRGVFSSKGKTWAIVSIPDNTLHKATVGDHIGLFFGKIEHISRTAIVLTQLVPDGTGCWQEQQAQLSVLPRAESTEDNPKFSS